MKGETIIDEITLGDKGQVVAMKGRVISKERIVYLDNACWKTIKHELDIEEMI